MRACDNCRWKDAGQEYCWDNWRDGQEGWEGEGSRYVDFPSSFSSQMNIYEELPSEYSEREFIDLSAYYRAAEQVVDGAVRHGGIDGLVA